MDVFDLVAKIRLDSSEYESGVGKAQGTFSKLASGVGKGLATVAKVGAAAVSAGVAGVAALTKMGVEGYAQYEQLVGGVETLFKESGDAVKAYAENAYKTSGLSANAYMETVTSFSASLIQSLDGDTAKAAEVADMAITDMSDNANKMGTSIEMIQNAYNGFAKGNFTMLDNLKLGYGGTQEEMKRLLKDAEALSGVKYDISSFADISEAIHVIQQDLEISGISYEEAMAKVASGEMTMEEATKAMGTTAREAATTIEGSLSMMKGAWENLVVGMADSNADMGLLVNNFVESTVTAANNIMPRIEQTLVGIGQLVEGLAPIIAKRLPAMVESVLPTLLTAASGLVTTLFNALPGLISSMLPVVITAGLDVIMAFLTTIRDNFGLLLETGLAAIIQLVDALTAPESIELLLDTAMVIISEIAWGLVDALPKLMESAMELILRLVDYLTEPQLLSELLEATLAILTKIAYGLIDAIPQLVDAALTIIENLTLFLIDPANIAMLLGAALEIVLAIATGIVNAIPRLLEHAIKMPQSIVQTFLDTDWGEVGGDIIDRLKSGISEAWEGLKKWFNGIWDNLFNRNVSVSVDDDGNASVNSHRTGLNYVPYDEYPALLHRGEAVLTAAEARVWRKGQATPEMAGGITIHQHIQSVPQTPVELASTAEAYFEQARWML